jgi:probable rRNA maturation factor
MIYFFGDEVNVPAGIEESLVPVMENICLDHSMNLEYLNVVFVTDEKLLEINRDFLQHDYYTDVITFNYAEGPERNIEGELYVSIDRVMENAQKLGILMHEELARVIIHGILHLCGYKDKEKIEQSLMQEAENKYIRQIVSRET